MLIWIIRKAWIARLNRIGRSKGAALLGGMIVICPFFRLACDRLVHIVIRHRKSLCIGVRRSWCS